MRDGGRPQLRSSSARSYESTSRTRQLRPSSRSRKDGGFVGNASWISSIINLLNTIVGAGTLAMPAALSHLGIVPGLMLIAWAGLTAGFGLYLQTRCARYLERGASSFFALSQITYPSAAVLFDAAIAIKCFGVGVSYLIIIGDLMPGVVHGFYGRADEVSYLVDRIFWITVFMLVAIPLSFLRKLDSLKYTSVVALLSITYLVVIVVGHWFAGDTLDRRGPIKVFKPEGALAALSSVPVLVFAYTCHQNMFSVLNEIKVNTPARTTGVVFTSIGSACFLYVTVALTGYLSFGDNVRGNIIGMYSSSILSTIGKAAIVVMVSFSYPLQVHPCRASLDAVLRWRPSGSATQRPYTSPSRNPLLPNNNPPKSPATVRAEGMGEARFAILSTVIIILSYIVAISIHSLERVLAYVGSTGSTSISFILPGLFYYKISDPHGGFEELSNGAEYEHNHDADEGLSANGNGGGKMEQQASTSAWLRRLSLALALYGTVVMVVSLTTNVYFERKHAQ